MKKLKKLKVDRQWCIALINSNIGPFMQAQTTYQPEGVQALAESMVEFIKKSSKLDKYQENIGLFLNDMSQGLNQMYNKFAAERLINWLENGVPTPSRIVTDIRRHMVNNLRPGKISPLNCG